MRTSFDEYLLRSEFATHATVWHVIVGPHDDINSPHRDGRMRDGRPYYLRHSFFNTDDYAREFIDEVLANPFEDSITFHVIR